MARFFRRYGIYLIILIGLALRLAVLERNLTAPLRGDENFYYQRATVIAQNVLLDRDVFRAPLYPYLLAFGMKVFGTTRATSGLGQVILDTMNIAAIYALGIALVKRRAAGLLAAFFYATFPQFIASPGFFFSEPIFVLLSSLGVLLLVNAQKSGVVRLSFFSGLFFALAALARELMAYFAIFFVPLWLALTGGGGAYSRIAKIVAFGAGLGLILIPYAARNWVLERQFILISSSGIHTLARDNIKVEIKLTHPTIAPRALTRSAGAQLKKELEAIPPAGRNAFMIKRGAKVILNHPWEWLMIKAKGIRALWNPSHTDLGLFDLDRLEPPLPIVSATLISVYFMFLVVFATWGFFIAPDGAPKLLVAMYIIYSIALFMLTHYQYRYRLPLLVLGLPYAAYGCLRLIDVLSAQNDRTRFWLSPRAVIATVVGLAFVLLMVSQFSPKY